jgi:hypothetical protein
VFNPWLKKTPCFRASAVKNAFALFCALSLSACVAPHQHHHRQAAFAPVVARDPETVLIHYYVIPGHEGEFLLTINQAWQIYQAEHLVLANPHVVLRETEADGKVRFDEILTWISHSTPEHASDSVKRIWDAEQALCEARGGHGGLNGGEVELMTPTQH